MGKPKYLIIKESLLESIEGQEANTPIQSEREISSHLNASRMTVRRAIEELVEEGILYRDKNKGTYVGDKKLHKKTPLLLLAEASKEDTTYNIIYFDVKTRDDEDIYEKLNTRFDDQYLRVVRLVSEKEIPTSVEEVYIARKNISDEDMRNLDTVLNLDYYIEQGILNQVFNPMIVPTQYANLLKMKINEPIIRVDSLISQKDGKPFVFVKSYYNPNKKKIEITL